MVFVNKTLDSLLSKPCDSTEVVRHLEDCLNLNLASLKQLDPESKVLIRYAANKAKRLNRLDVVKKLREIAPAGTIGELLPLSFCGRLENPAILISRLFLRVRRMHLASIRLDFR